MASAPFQHHLLNLRICHLIAINVCSVDTASCLLLAILALAAQGENEPELGSPACVRPVEVTDAAPSEAAALGSAVVRRFADLSAAAF